MKKKLFTTMVLQDKQMHVSPTLYLTGEGTLIQG